MNEQTHRLDRTITIAAAPETVFRFFTDSARWAKWWGAGSEIDARVGGQMRIRYPNAVEAAGEVLEVDPPRRIVFTYGYASGQPIAVGASTVTIAVEAVGGGSRVDLVHSFTDPGVCDQHVQGWRFQLSVFANIVADEVFAGATTLVDGWFDAWAESGDAARAAAFADLLEGGALFRDRYSCLAGPSEISLHAGAAQRFMPGIRLRREGAVRHCQGTVLADWVAAGPDGVARMKGTNVFSLSPGGRIASVTGIPA